MTKLSPLALATLRKIKSGGLTVLWSFRCPHPRYRNGKPFPYDNWSVIQDELTRREEKQDYLPTQRRHWITRTSIQAGFKIVEKFLRVADGTERLTATNSTGLSGSGIPDQIVSEQHSYEQEGQTMYYTSVTSEWINWIKVDADAYTEEFIGLTYRAELTDKALALLELRDVS